MTGSASRLSQGRGADLGCAGRRGWCGGGLEGTAHHRTSDDGNDALPVPVRIMVIGLVVVPEGHRVVAPLGRAAFVGAGAEGQVVAQPVAGVAVGAAGTARDPARAVVGHRLVV